MTSSREAQGESPEQQLEVVAETGIDRAMAHLVASFEGEGRDRLYYHDTVHTGGGMSCTEEILIAMREGGEDVTDEDIEVGKLGYAYHDIVQDWDTEERKLDDGSVAIMRKRHAGENERQSAKMLRAYIDEANERFAEPVIDTIRADAAELGILATIASFDGKTTYQEAITEAKKPLHPITRAMALADLGEAGMGGFLEHLHSADALFREENMDVTETLFLGEELSEDQQISYRQRMLDWTHRQKAFAEGRRDLLDAELAGLTPDAQEHVRALFSRFEETIDGMDERATEREEMSFAELIRDMGYSQ